MWLNRVQRLSGPTHSGRFSKFALLAIGQRSGADLEKETDAQLVARSRMLQLKARQGDSINTLIPEAFALTRKPPSERSVSAISTFSS